MERLLMKVKCHFCRGIIQFPHLGVSSEQPRVLDSLSWPPVLVAGMAGCSH